MDGIDFTGAGFAVAGAAIVAIAIVFFRRGGADRWTSGWGYKAFVARRYLLVPEPKVTAATKRMIAIGVGARLACELAVALGVDASTWRAPMWTVERGVELYLLVVVVAGVVVYSRPALYAFFVGTALLVAGLVMGAKVYKLPYAPAPNIDLPEPVQRWYVIAVLVFTVLGAVLAGLSILFGCLRSQFTFFTTVPIGGVWIGTAALVCVLAVMSGFESDLREKILGSNAHIQVTREDGEFTEWREVKNRIAKIPGIIASTPYAVSEVVIAANSNGMNVIIKGIDPQSVGAVTDLVNDLEDKDAMENLEPLSEPGWDLRVPQTSDPPSSPTLDPPPVGVPVSGDPIDFSAPSARAASPDAGAGDAPSLDTVVPKDPPADDSEGAGRGVPHAAIGDGPAEGNHQGKAAIAGAPKEVPLGGPGGASIDLRTPLTGVLRTPAEPGLSILPDLPETPRSEGSGSIQPRTPSAGGQRTSADPGSSHSDDPGMIEVFDLPGSSSGRTRGLPGILVGRELAKQTHLYTGQEVHLVSPLSDASNPDATGMPIPFNRDYRVAGIFFTGMFEYDLKYVYVTLDSLQDFLDRGDAVDGIEIRVKNPDNSGVYVERLVKALGTSYRVQDWTVLNRSLFSALKLEKIAMFIVLGIVILVASFSIVGNLIMVVVEKGREIALLKTLGASDPGVMQLFAIQGLLIGVIGTVLGVATGLVACYLGKRVGIPLNPDVYYIDKMPVHVDPSSVVITFVAGVSISIAATFYPAILAARVRPATGLRH